MSRFAVFICSIFLFLSFSLISRAQAEIHEVKMLNRGESGIMVFEPDYLEIQPGDSIKFIASHKSHNAASIDTMLPEGADKFRGKIDEELQVTFDQAGYYGIKCTPHYAMGMIMLVKVGEADLPQTYRDHRHPGLAQKRFDAIFTAINADH